MSRSRRHPHRCHSHVPNGTKTVAPSMDSERILRAGRSSPANESSGTRRVWSVSCSDYRQFHNPPAEAPECGREFFGAVLPKS